MRDPTADQALWNMEREERRVLRFRAQKSVRQDVRDSQEQALLLLKRLRGLGESPNPRLG